jgi:hypothetical protein
LTYLELYGDSRLRAIVFSDDSPCHLRDGIFSADQALAAIDALQGPDAIGFSKGFSDQFLTGDELPEWTPHDGRRPGSADPFWYSCQNVLARGFMSLREVHYENS